MMENTKYAGFFPRLLAHLLDKAMEITVFLLIVNSIFTKTTYSEMLNSVTIALLGLLYLGIVTPVFYAYLVSKVGATPGKLLTGLKIVREEGSLVSIKRALFRTYIGRPVSAVFMGLGYLWVFKDEKRRGWHDMVTGSVVIKSNTSGVFVGVLALVALILINFGLTKSVFGKAVANKGIYTEMFNDIKDEVNAFKTKVGLDPKPVTDGESSMLLKRQPLASEQQEGYATYLGVKNKISFEYPNYLTVYDLSQADTPLINLTLDSQDGVSKSSPIITIESDFLTQDFSEYVVSKYKKYCPPDFDSCTPPTKGPANSYYQFESINRHYAGIDTYITDQSNPDTDYVFNINMSARNPNQEFTPEEKKIYDDIINSFRFISY